MLIFILASAFILFDETPSGYISGDRHVQTRLYIYLSDRESS